MKSSKAQGISEALGLGPREHVALVGAGGKTTLLFTLARELRGRGARVVTATTTRVSESESRIGPCRVVAGGDPGWREEVQRALDRHGQVFVCARVDPEKKVSGVAPGHLDALFRGPRADYVLVEADGASRRPLKAPAAHEPVIPRSATLVVALAGLDAVGKPLAEETVFRVSRVAEVTGLAPAEVVGPRAVSRLFISAAGLFKGCPAGARRIAFLNKTDIPGARRSAAAVAAILLASGPCPRRVVAGSLKEERYWIYEARS